MPHDRRSRRVLLAMLGLAGVAMSVGAGCARSSNLRSSAGPLPELAPAGELRPAGGAAAPGANSPTPPDGANPGGSAMSWSQSTPSMPISTNVDPSPTPTSNPNAATPAGGSPVPTGTEAANGSAAGAGSSPSPMAAPAGEPAATPISPTPLLDAELRRARAVTRQHFESLNAIETPTPLPDPVDLPTVRPTTADVVEPKPADPEPDPVPPLPPLAASARIAVAPETPGSAGNVTLPTLMPVDPAASGSDTTAPGSATSAPTPPPPMPATSVTPEKPGTSSEQLAATIDAPDNRRPAIATDEEKSDGTATGVAAATVAAEPARTDERPSPSGQPAAAPDRSERPRLEIAELKLCSRVKKIGEVEVIDHEQLKTGRPMLVYCEMAGLEYQPRGAVFVSRLAAHIELRSGSDGPVVWEQAPGTAEYVCNRPPDGYFVSYRIDLPGSLEPGPYRLRLVQTDLVGNRVASREIPVTVGRPSR